MLYDSGWKYELEFTALGKPCLKAAKEVICPKEL